MNLCKLCRYQKFENITKVKNRQIIKCQNCQLIAISSLPSESDTKQLLSLISPNFFKEYLTEETSYQAYFQSKLNDIKKFKRKPKLLDIGCGPGTLLNLAKSSGFDCLGLDISPEAIRMCRIRGLNAKLSQIASLSPKNKFNVITAFQVIEHVLDPELFLKKTFNLLEKNGILVITTPNQHGWISFLTNRYWFEYYNLEHFYFFSPKTLTAFVEKAGFKLIFCRTENSRRLNINYVLNRLIGYYYTQNSLLQRLKPILNWLFKKFTFKEPMANIYLIASKE